MPDRTGQAAHNRAILRGIADNLQWQTRTLKVGSHKRLAAAWNKDCLRRLLGLGWQPISMPAPCPNPSKLDARATNVVI